MPTIEELFSPEQDALEAPDNISSIFGDDKERAVSESINYALGKSPDKQASIQKVARDTKTNPDFAERNFDELKKMDESSKINIESLLKDSPKLADRFRDPMFAEVAWDDIETLSTTEKAVNAIYKAMKDVNAIASLSFDEASEWLPPAGAQVTLISAGTGHNVVPDLCIGCGICENVCPRSDAPGILNSSEEEQREFEY